MLFASGGQVRMGVCFIPHRTVKKQTVTVDRRVEGSRWKGLGRRNDPSSTSTPQIVVAVDRYTLEADATGVIDDVRSNSSIASNNERQQQQLINDKREQLAGALIIQISYTSSSSVNAALLSRIFTLEDVEPNDPTSAGQRLWLHATKSVVDMHGGNIRAVPLSHRGPGGASTGVSFIIELPMTRIVDLSSASGSNSVVQSSLPSSIPTGNAQGLGLDANGQGLGQGSDNQPLSQPLLGTTTNAHSDFNHSYPLFPNDGNNHLSHGHTNNNNHNHDRCTSEIDRASMISRSDVMSSITLPNEVLSPTVNTICPPV